VDGGEEDGGGAEMGSAVQWIGLGGREVRDSLRTGGWWDQREARGEVQARADAGGTRDRMKVHFFLHFILFNSRDKYEIV
jgi:hypothetical protein